MSQVQTVLGPIDVADLGRTLIHEHLFPVWPGAQFDPRFTVDRAWLIDQCVMRLGAIKDLGVRTFVDPCPIELGRDVGIMMEVSRRVGMNIICTTGFYHEGPGLPPHWQNMPAGEIADFYVREIEEGIAGYGARPGAIKCATSAIPTPLEEKFVEAAAIAQRRGGVPIITHTSGGLGGPEQQALFARHGTAPHRCLIGHVCDSADPDYHRRVASGGTYVGFDRIGFDSPPPQVSALNMARLMDEGFGRQLMLSMDRPCWFAGKTSRRMPTDDKAELDDMIARGVWPPPHTFLFTDFIPMLRAEGVSDHAIFALLDENPTRFFAGEPF